MSTGNNGPGLTKLGTVTVRAPISSPGQVQARQKYSLRSQSIIPFVSVMLVLIFIFLFLFLARNDIFQTSVAQPCPAGFCANDIYSGAKTCPANSSGVVQHNPGFQDCNPPTGCQEQSQAPCLYYDPKIGTVCPGDPNYNGGLCPAGTSSSDCKCTSRIYCPDFATVYFVEDTITTPGLKNECVTLTTFTQETTWIDAAGLARNDLPISPGPVGSNQAQCGLVKSQLANVWPNSTCIFGKLTLAEQDNLYYCTNVPSTLICPIGEIPFLKTDGTYTCQKDSAAEQFNVHS